MFITYSNRNEYFEDDEHHIISSNLIGTSLVEFVELDFSQIIAKVDELYKEVDIDISKEEISHNVVFEANNLISLISAKHIYLRKFRIHHFFGSEYFFDEYKDTKEINSRIRSLVGSLGIETDRILRTQSEFKTIIEFCFLCTPSEAFQKLNSYQRFYYYLNYEEKRVKKKEQFDMGIPDHRIRFDKERESVSRIGVYKQYEILPMNEININKTEMSKEKIIETISNTQFELNEKYSFHITDSSGLNSICYNQLMEMLKSNVIVNTCKHCGKLFIPEGRMDTEYCNRSIPNSVKTCREVGAIKKYHERTKNNPIMREFQKEYKKMNSRVRIKKISQNKFYEWSEKARELRDTALRENWNEADFINKLKKLEV